MKTLVLGAIRGYQILISPILPPTCRYHPSCSSFALQAVRRWGVLRGTGLGPTPRSALPSLGSRWAGSGPRCV